MVLVNLQSKVGDEKFLAASNTDYIAVVLDNNSRSGCADGDIINLTQVIHLLVELEQGT